MKRQRSHNRRQYPRVARINELLREILAEELDRIDDQGLELATITGVDCDAALKRAKVFFDGPQGPEGDDELTAAFEGVRIRLQHAIASQARLRNTPELRFAPDPAVRAGERIEAILRDIADDDADAGDDADTGDADDGAEPNQQ